MDIHNTFLEMKPAEATFQEVVEGLGLKNVPFGTRGNRLITFNINLSELQQNSDTHEWLAARLIRESLSMAQKT